MRQLLVCEYCSGYSPNLTGKFSIYNDHVQPMIYSSQKGEYDGPFEILKLYERFKCLESYYKDCTNSSMVATFILHSY